MSKLTAVDGGVTASAGFRAAGVSAGLKGAGKPDVALLVSDRPASAAGVFTTNKVTAAPVKLCRAAVATGHGRAVVANSGNANACTGERGVRDAARMCEQAADLLGLAHEDVYVCSTGTIGVPLPMDRVEAGIREAAAGLSSDGGPSAASAIMTTDTVAKQAAFRGTLGGAVTTVGGMCKGAGMIHPNMATMLAFVTTDARVEPASLQALLVETTGETFNAISVDGDESTNDTVLCFANGAAGGAALAKTHPDWVGFAAAFRRVCAELALKIVRDGEGATKLVALTVRGARSRADAECAARAVANSLLVKTSWFGEDPNWGRVLCAVGYSGAEVVEASVSIAYDGIPVLEGGQPVGGAAERVKAVLAKTSFALEIDLHIGAASRTIHTCDCSTEYVHINSAYMT